MKKFIILLATLTLLLCSSLSLMSVSAGVKEEEKLLYTIDFSTAPDEYTSDGGLSDGAGWDGYEILRKQELEAMGFTVGVKFNLSGHESARFYQTAPGKYFTDCAETRPFFLSVESSTSLLKKVEDETYVKIYVDPVVYYSHGSIWKYDYNPETGREDIPHEQESYTDPQIRVDPVHLLVNEKNVSDNVTGVIEVDLTRDEVISIARANNGYTQAQVIYKIEFYGIEEAEETGATGLDTFFEKLGLGGLTIGVQLVIIVAAIIVLKKVIK